MRDISTLVVNIFGEYWCGNDDNYDKHGKANDCLCNG